MASSSTENISLTPTRHSVLFKKKRKSSRMLLSASSYISFHFYKLVQIGLKIDSYIRVGGEWLINFFNAGRPRIDS